MKTIAIIGCGRICNLSHLPQLTQMKDVQIKYVCDIIGEKAQAAKENFVPNAQSAYVPSDAGCKAADSAKIFPVQH